MAENAIARRISINGPAKVLFVDRDGTILEEPDDFQVDAFRKMRFVEGVLPALRALRSAGWRLVMVSNQDGLGTKSFPRKHFEGPHNLMMQILESQGAHTSTTSSSARTCPARVAPAASPRRGSSRPTLRKASLTSRTAT